jgi:hypothetical protein
MVAVAGQRQQIVRKIELFRSGFAARHVEREASCAERFVLATDPVPQSIKVFVLEISDSSHHGR